MLNKTKILFLLFILILKVYSQSATTDIDSDFFTSEQQWLNAENFSSISFKNNNSEIKKSPGSITVISQREIREMGAKGIIDVLDTIPGFSSWYGAYNQRISARGILRTASQDILFMINGLPVTSNYIGSGLWSHFNISTDHIKRIEIVRGPSSSIYGANAFSGIVNIITFDGGDIDGVKISQQVGSYNSNKTSLIAGKKYDSGLELALHASYYKTEGYKGTINFDRQSIFDDNFNTNASLAPGKTDNFQRRLDLGMKLKYENFFLDSSYATFNRGGNVGIFDALGEKNDLQNSDGYITTGYRLQVTDKLTITPSVYYHRSAMHNYITFLPKNSKIWADFSDFSQGLVDLPDGIKGIYNATNERVGFSIDNIWQPTNNYQVLFGFEYEKMRQFDTKQEGSHYFDGSKIVILDKWQNIPSEYTFLPDAQREFYALYLENIWDLTSELRLTYGGRYDFYKHYHNSFCPRVSIIWEYLKGYDVKLSYSRAFRTPSFYELYNNQPFVMGNANLSPEYIDSYELSFGAKINDRLSGRVTLFYNEISDMITEYYYLDSSMIEFRNSEEVSNIGVEFETKYKLNRGSYFNFNYTYLDTYDKNTRSSLGKVSRHTAYFGLNLRLSSHISWFSSLNFLSAQTPRLEDNFKNYGSSLGIVNTGLTFHNFIKNMDGFNARFFIYNLFDKDYACDYSTNLPSGAPQPGRNFMFELSYEF